MKGATSLFSIGVYIVLILISAITSCKEDTDELDLNGVDNTLATFLVDTATVRISTVLLDSVATSETGTLLAGQFNDDLLGATTASAYFKISLPSSWSVSDEAVFDSIRLILPYSGYTSGDTTQTTILDVYPLAATIQTKNLPPYIGTEESASYFYSSPALYNTSNTRTEAESLNTFSFQPRPTEKDSISIPLPKSMGAEWFRLKKANDNRLVLANEFLEYFKGLKISSASNSSKGAIVGFTANQVKIRLYYRQPSGQITANLSVDFPLLAGTYTQYNNISTQYSQPALQGIERGGKAVASSAAGNMAFTQAGTGLMVKLEFPYLGAVNQSIDLNFINKAYLEISPVTGTTRYPYLLPANLALYVGDANNVPISPLTQNYSEELQIATYQADIEYNQNSKYQFDITEYLINKLKNQADLGYSLLLAAPSTSYSQTVNRVAVGDSKHPTNKVKLKIYYTKIQ